MANSTNASPMDDRLHHCAMLCTAPHGTTDTGGETTLATLQCFGPAHTNASSPTLGTDLAGREADSKAGLRSSSICVASPPSLNLVWSHVGGESKLHGSDENPVGLEAIPCQNTLASVALEPKAQLRSHCHSRCRSTPSSSVAAGSFTMAC
jgi:hypothetical protein